MIIKIQFKFYFFIALSFIFQACQKPDFDSKHKQIVLRNIGHRLLLSAHDSRSLVLPIMVNSENQYQIRFEKPLTFANDSLIKIVDENLKKAKIDADYILNVHACASDSVVYAYEFSSKTGSILPCSGRKSPLNCYYIQIDFLPSSRPYWLIIVCLIFALVYFALRFWPKKGPITSAVVFNLEDEKCVLHIDEKAIVLTQQETQLLRLLIDNGTEQIMGTKPNNFVNRDTLIYEIWEKQGVVVSSRSLDVLVSKIRKKLKGFSNISIKNIHGRGYKLEF
jgi:DNA-binding winged helix-turn-helix (wHTH) protein